MLTHKKFIAAFALLSPLFGACVVTDGDDDGASTGGATDSASASASASATDSASASASASATDSASATGDSTGPDTDTGGSAGYCNFTCAEAIDCCAGEPTCEAGIGTYPYAWTCDGGFCAFGGCTSDDECTMGGALPAWICADIGGGTMACQPGCAADMDCEDQFLMGWTCTGGDGSYCQPPGCTADADCGAGFTCDTETGACLVPPCTADADCGDLVCDTATGLCGCTDDAQCGEGSSCVIE